MPEKMKILVAIQFTESPDEIINWTMSLAKKYKATVYTVHIIEELPRISFYSDAYKIWQEFRDSAVKETLAKMNQYLKKLADNFNDMESIIEVGKPGEKIIELSEKLKVDLIIVGHQIRKNIITQIAQGSVCEKVIRMAKIPVIVLPIAAKD
jgi:nucleotide-binding universal stress UspA family protein